MHSLATPMTDTSYIGSQPLAPDPNDGYHAPSRYKVTFMCDVCGNQFSRIYKVIPKKDPACPRFQCKMSAANAQANREQANFEQMIEERRPPGHIGANVSVKAVDATAEIVMSDYGMTNLQDNVRAGDVVAPKLPGEQQAMADNFFGGGKAIEQRTGISGARLNRLGRMAMAGANRGMALNPSDINIGKRGESALWSARKESLR